MAFWGSPHHCVTLLYIICRYQLVLGGTESRMLPCLLIENMFWFGQLICCLFNLISELYYYRVMCCYSIAYFACNAWPLFYARLFAYLFLDFMYSLGWLLTFYVDHGLCLIDLLTTLFTKYCLESSHFINMSLFFQVGVYDACMHAWD